MPAMSSWWTPSRHADRRGLLAARGHIKAAIRTWFESEGFIEVDTGCLQVSPGNETHLHAFKTEAIAPDLGRRTLYLHTSPEFAMKKLLAAGEEKIFTFAPVFRNRERGALHAPEFTMLEWYRTDATAETLWRDCAEILAIASTVSARQVWTWRGRECNVRRPLCITSFDHAFETHAGIAVTETYNATGTDRDSLAALAARAGIKIRDDDTWSDLISRILTDKVDAHLGAPAPEILMDYPIHEAALARPRPSQPHLAERFELYVAGVELANGFGELTDVGEQRRRFEQFMLDKQRIYAERYPIDEDFLAALAEMPPAAGCALGFDRLVMLATGATRIDQVIWTPFPDIEGAGP